MPSSIAVSASRRLLAVCLVCLLALSITIDAQPPAPASAPTTADIDAYVARVLKTFDVPGIALAIVKDGRVVLAKGYGVRRLGEPTPVDERTLFGIASNTKVFTATALALLVEDGTIQWDAPVIKYLPWFQMYDPYVTRELTIRDLLVHRSGLGLGAGDLLWWPASDYNRKDVARRLQFIKPATSFRSAYAYDNVLYLVAGEVIEAVSGQSWEDFVTTRILRKVGMADSKPRHSDANAAAQGANVATSHAPIDGKVRPVKPFDSDNTNPAGGINASAADIAKWMLVRLADGKLPDGSRLYSDGTSRTLTTLVTPMPIPSPPPELAALAHNFNGYALGLNVYDYRGHKVITHDGGLPGYVSRITVIPDTQLGVAVLTNQESGAAFNALIWLIVDRYLNAPTTDWIDQYSKLIARQTTDTAAKAQRAAAARDAASKPSLRLEQYAGTYTDAWYGDVAIAQENGKLVMRFTHTPALVGDLEHWQHDSFIVRWRDRELRADAYVIFALDADGSVDQIKMRAASPTTDFSFDFQDLLLRPAGRASGRR